ncbi:MAG: hypothetical protein EOP40_07300 [Rubrivivax sp.]|nr:MAG: hypothetical protein EOP40_07300 [Rubrivivax sp.]
MTLFPRLVAMWCLAGMLPACSPALDWREVRPPEATGLVAMFPCKPQAYERSLALPGVAGGPLRMHLLACQAEGVTWAVSYFTATSPAQRAQALAALREALWHNTASAAPAQASRQLLGAAAIPGATPHPDATVWHMQGQRPLSTSRMQPVQLMAWHFSHGMAVFQASASAEALRVDDPRLEAFERGLTFPP